MSETPPVNMSLLIAKVYKSLKNGLYFIFFLSFNDNEQLMKLKHLKNVFFSSYLLYISIKATCLWIKNFNHLFICSLIHTFKTTFGLLNMDGSLLGTLESFGLG